MVCARRSLAEGRVHACDQPDSTSAMCAFIRSARVAFSLVHSGIARLVLFFVEGGAMMSHRHVPSATQSLLADAR